MLSELIINHSGSNIAVIYVPKKQGGVRNVTLSLAKGLRHNGYQVEEVNNVLNFVILRFKYKHALAISSLACGFISFIYRDSIFIIHGFPTKDTHSFIKEKTLIIMPWIVSKFGVKLVAVSYLTQSIYKRIYGVKIDYVVHNGISNDFIEKTKNEIIFKKNKTLLYVGRLIPGKGVENILSAFLSSKLPFMGYDLKILGDGPLMKKLKHTARGINGIYFLGEVSEKDKVEVFFRSEIFISLNDFEPMGVVFAEAIASKCKIVAPHCGGHREFIPVEYPLFLCDSSSKMDIVDALEKAALSKKNDQLIDVSIFSYDMFIAKKYIDISKDNK